MRPTESISNRSNTFDSRDVIARIGELLSNAEDAEERVAKLCEEREGLTDDTLESAARRSEIDALLTKAEADSAAMPLGSYFNADDREELVALQRLEAQCKGYGDWADGETLIRESYFVEYAQELANDIGSLPPDAAWPLTHIDWQAAADELKTDYMEVDFDGVPYLMRA